METGHLKYGAHGLQEARVYQYSSSNKNTLLFVHGGAWRDPSNTYHDFDQLVHSLQHDHHMHHTNMVSMNYRLSPDVKHPAHLVDVMECISYMARQGCGRLSIVGHSVGATLMMQLLNWKKMGIEEVREVTFPQFGTFYFVDGIYDMVDLVQEYGDPYREFVEMAFSGDYSEFSQLSWSQQCAIDVVPQKLVVVYSNQDELLSERQSSRFVEHLRAHNYPVDYLRGNWGLHEEVYRRTELADIIAKGIITEV